MGEELAARQLRSWGYRVLEHGWRCRLGEIDLIALDGPIVVIVEVKTRRGVGYGQPGEAVGPSKQRRLARLATAYLAARGWLERPCRFDVVEVLWPPDSAPVVDHTLDAFRPEGGRSQRRGRC